MSTSVSMWLGILFLLLGIAAVLLQAWLWGPKFWDEAKKKTCAPRAWLRVHATCGYAYAAIYVFMMWHMVPRLWQYQYELPARTVIHAVVGVTIGVLLVSKIAILRWFRHFEESMPYFGFGLLLSTIILTFLSVPYALQAEDIRGRVLEPENVARVERILSGVNLPAGYDAKSLTTKESFERGHRVLVTKCTACHDMRTILIQPRTGKRWYDVVDRMLDKPHIVGEPLEEADVPPVTAYLVAITPDLQRSRKRRREDARKKQMMAAKMTRPEVALDAAPPLEAKIEPAVGDELIDKLCTDCHGLEDLDEHGADTVAGWSQVIAEMIEEGAEVEMSEGKLLARYLAQKYPN